MNADGHGVSAIMREVFVSKTTVWRWQEYFLEAGVEGLLKGRSKPPGKKPLSPAMKLAIVEKTVKERPEGATPWSVRAMAQEMGISHTSVQRIWAEHGLKPHLVRRFKISKDPYFAEKVQDIAHAAGDLPACRRNYFGESFFFHFVSSSNAFRAVSEILTAARRAACGQSVPSIFSIAKAKFSVVVTLPESSATSEFRFR